MHSSKISNQRKDNNKKKSQKYEVDDASEKMKGRFYVPEGIRAPVLPKKLRENM